MTNLNVNVIVVDDDDNIKRLNIHLENRTKKS